MKIKPRMSNSFTRTLRSLLREPSLSLSALALLTLGLTVCTMGASLLTGFGLHPTPFDDASRLVEIWGSSAEGRERGALSYAEVEALQQAPVSGITAFAGHRSIVAILPDRTETVASASVDGKLFSALGARLVAGRAFTREERPQGGAEVCVISQALWRRVFSGEGFAPGRALRVDGRDRVVLGLAAEGFGFPEASTELWFPVEQGPFAALLTGDSRSFGAVARLDEGTTVSSLDQALAAIMSARSAGLGHELRRSAWVEPLRDAYLRPVEGPLALLGAGMLVVLIATLFNLALVQGLRSALRRRSTAIRLALGAGRWTLLAAAAREASVLAIVAALLAWPLGRTVLHRLTESTGLDGVSPGIVFEPLWLLPGSLGVWLVLLALAAPKVRIGTSFGSWLRGGEGLGLAPWRRIATLQVGLSVVLIFAALSFFTAYRELSRIELGFDPAGLYASEIVLPRARYPAEETDPSTWVHNHQAVRAMLEEVRARPGLAATTLGMVHPTSDGWTRPYRVPGGSPDAGPPRIRVRVVADRYFEVVGLPVLEGRGIEAGDVMGALPVAVINASAKRELFGTEDPLGRSLEVMGMDRRVVGVVGDVPFLGLDQPHVPAVYTSYFQTPTGWFFLITRAGAGAGVGVMQEEAEAALQAVDPGLSLPRFREVSERLTRSLTFYRSALVLAVWTAAAIVILALLGVYGLMRASVFSWRREMAVRAALGGSRSRVVGLALERSATVFLGGAALGGGLVVVGVRLLRTWVEMEAVGPLPLALATILAACVCLLPTLGPLLRLWRLDPAEVLRS
ncbi:MAG: ABC transporter permease [Acidobacteria bacterium]|nr:ABC transporter permease [Acidobacteriota bacterium]